MCVQHQLQGVGAADALVDSDCTEKQQGTDNRLHVQAQAPNLGAELWCALSWWVVAQSLPSQHGRLGQYASVIARVVAASLCCCLQVTARVLAESGSHPGVGLTPQAGMYAEVTAVVQARLLAKAAAATSPGEDAAPVLHAAGGSGISSASAPAGQSLGGAAGADELQLLSQHGVLPAAHGVYSSLVTCLQHPHRQQQQQQESQSDCGGVSLRLQSAAASAAALAPGLLVSMLRQQAGAPAVKLVS